MPDDTKLLPCPFCGGTAHFERLGTPRQSCIVECDSCGVRHESSDEGERSGTQWNERTAPAPAAQPAMPEPVALVQFLEGLLSTWGRPPTEQELRAAAHALTVRADRIACARTPESDGA